LAAWLAAFANGHLCCKTHKIYLIVNEVNPMVLDLTADDA
jgi:hypothetical protein